MSSKVIVALDFDNEGSLETFLSQVNPELCRVKVGKALFTRFGPALVQRLHNKGFDVFLDLKFHDIPNTVYGAVKAAVDLGVWMVNVHALGGERMLQAAKKATDGAATLLIAVTVLTSFTNDELNTLGIKHSVDDEVELLAKMTLDSGLDGIVCSAYEASKMKEICGQSFQLVCPGIRLLGDSHDDQRRVLSPTEAIKLGADYLVMGRSIIQHQDPSLCLKEILMDIQTHSVE